MIIKLLSLIDKKQKNKLILITFLILTASFVELLSLGAVIPVLNTLMEPNLNEIKSDIIAFIPDILSLKNLIKEIFNPLDKIQVLYIILLGLFFIYLLKSFLLILISWALISFSASVQKTLSNKLFNIYLARPFAFHISKNSSRLLRNINWSSTLSRGVMTFVNFLSDVLIFALIIITLIIYQPITTITIFLLIIFIILIYQRVLKKIFKRYGEQSMFHDGEKTKSVYEAFGSIKEVILYNLEKNFSKVFETHNNSAIDIDKKNSFLSSIPRIFLELFAVILLSFVILYNSAFDEQLQKNIIIIGFYTLALFKLMPIVNKILINLNSFFYLEEVVNKIYLEFITKNERSKTYSEESIDFVKKMKLQKLNFNYPNKENVLENINIEILKGDKIGVIGKTGEGKSTLINIIIGLLSPNSGNIFIDDKLLNNLNVKSWQRKINYVPQNIFLLDDTIKKNINFDQVDTDNNNKITEALKKACLVDFVEKLPNKILTKVGEGGAQISGGQKQRLGLARAFYNRREILILDEATNSLDLKTEKQILRHIYEDKNLTVIFISHKLENLDICNKVYEVKDLSVSLIKGKNEFR